MNDLQIEVRFLIVAGISLFFTVSKWARGPPNPLKLFIIGTVFLAVKW
jgi:hypothetical protein